MTQTDFAKSIGKGMTTIQNWEAGKVMPPELQIDYICAVFDVNKEWLMTGNGEMFMKNTSNSQVVKGDNNSVQLISGFIGTNIFQSPYQQHKDDRLNRLFELITKYATPAMIDDWEKKLLKIKKLHEE